MKRGKKRKSGIEKEAGCVLMETASALMRQGSTIDKILESLEMCLPGEDYEDSATYQALVAGADGIQRTLDEMNDVLSKFGYTE